MIEPQEKAVALLTQWLGRVLQYSIAHPVARELGTKVHEAFAETLRQSGALDVGVLKDELLFGDVKATLPVLRLRAAPHLHERGVLVIRFAEGVRPDELTALVELLALPVTDLFARGGLSRLLPERGVSRIRVEELGHDLTAEERDVDRRQKRLLAAFRDTIARVADRRGLGRSSQELIELLEHPQLSARLLAEQENVCEAVAGIVLLALQLERRSGLPLQHKTRALLLELTPDVRVQVFLGYPALAGDFREALTTIFEGFSEVELARFAFPCVWYRPEELERFFYVAGAVTHANARRLGFLRRVAAMLHDLPLDNATNLELLSNLSGPPEEGDRYADARAIVAAEAERVTSATMLFDGPHLASEPRADSFAPTTLDRLSQREASEVISLAATMVDFDEFCARLPRAAEYLAGGAGTKAVSGLFHALREVKSGAGQEAAEEALRGIARSSAAHELVRDVENAAALEGERLDDALAVLKVLARERPEPLLDLLARVESRKVRRMLLDLLPDAGDALLPLVRARLAGREWYVVRNMVTLVRRVGGTSADLLVPARHAQPQVRLEAVRALRGMTDEGAQQILASLLDDPVPDVRGVALAVLGEMELGPAALAAVIELAGDPRRDDETRQRAIAALGRSKSDDAARGLSVIVEHRAMLENAAATALRDLAAVNLHQSRAPLAGTLFEQALHSSNRRARKAAEAAAGGRDE